MHMSRDFIQYQYNEIDCMYLNADFGLVYFAEVLNGHTNASARWNHCVWWMWNFTGIIILSTTLQWCLISCSSHAASCARCVIDSEITQNLLISSIMHTDGVIKSWVFVTRQHFIVNDPCKGMFDGRVSLIINHLDKVITHQVRSWSYSLSKICIMSCFDLSNVSFR